MPAPVVDRKCRECGKVSRLVFLTERCPKCKAEYGVWAVGFDRVVDVEVGKKRK